MVIVYVEINTQIMSILTIIIVIVLVGLLLWFVETYVPMAPPVKRILEGVVILILILWLLQSFGILGSIGIPRLR